MSSRGQRIYSLDKPALFVSSLFLSFCIIFGAACILGYNSFTKATDAAHRVNATRAALLARVVLERQKTAMGVLQSYGRRSLLIDSVKRKDFPGAIRHLYDLAKNNPEVEWLYIANPDSTVWVNYPVDKRVFNKDLSGRDWYKGVSREWVPYISSVLEMFVGEKDLAVTVSAPVLDENGKVIGILATAQGEAYFRTIFDGVISDSDAHMALIDQKGHIIYSNRLPYTNEIIDYPSFDLVRRAAKGEKGDVEIQDPSDGNKVKYISYAPIGRIGWSIIVEKAKGEVFKSQYSNFALIAVISFLMYAVVASSLIHFRARQRQIRSLEKINEELDGRVRERTADLGARNQELNQEISERKRAEATLRREEKRYRDLGDLLPQTIFEADESGNLTFVNRSAFDNFGYTQEDFANGLNVAQMLAPEERERVKEVFSKTLSEERGSREAEITALRKDHTTFPAIVFSGPIVQSGKSVGVRGFIIDITGRKRSENELLRAKETADAANKAKSEFLANMSHEIRTPMNGIIGMTGLLLDTPLVPEQREYAEAVRVSADSLLRIINDILDFSKIEAGKMDLEILDFDLRTTVEDTVDMMAVKAEEKKLELACFLHHDVPSLLRGDPGRLRQILLNLAGNAIKFTEKGEVAIRVTLEDESDTHARLRFAVSDTGTGISKDRMDRLFKSFSQVDASTTRKFGGTGLGLVISKKLAETMGGRMGVESEEGRGSTFWFTGIFDKQPGGEETTSSQPAEIRGLRILVVDDNPTNRIILREQLRSWGCLPEEAPDGESAWAKLQEAMEARTPFRLAILDMEMPNMDGAMLGRKIKEDPKLRATMLVLLTSRGNRGDAKEMKAIGFSAYLTKPIKASQLHDCLTLVVSREPLERKAQPMPIVTRHSISEEKKRNIRILLAEDNVVNQKVALRILERIGYRADAVANGKEVLSALEIIPYDLILMDVQMPEMDGFEATAAIRAKEMDLGGHIPIIAMTAHAMKGDREHCLEAGMDDYVSKPIQPQSLIEVIGRWVDKVVLKKSEGPLIEPSEAREVFDKRGLLDRLGGDEAFLREILGTFLDDAPKQIERMQRHLKEEDLVGLGLQAHSLKGAAMNIGGNGLQKVAFEIEVAARNRELDRARKLVTEILKEFKSLKTTLDRSIAPRSDGRPIR
jgi:two-component system sensor histidine kinase/response regulator